ncbi:hypothetical protein CPC16_008851 [Podila verticillata]|nr:hypothetical protein CPC16_008851 [Podila verticillata]
MSTRAASSSSASVPQRYMPGDQFQEGIVAHASSDWPNPYSDQAMKATASMSSLQSWSSVDPSQTTSSPSHRMYSPRQAPSQLPPPRGSSSSYTSNRSNSNNSNASAAPKFTHNDNGGGHQTSPMSSGNFVYPQYQQPQKQPSQQYHDLSGYQPTSSFTKSSVHRSTSDMSSASYNHGSHEYAPSSQSLMQSMDQRSTQQGSPRMGHRSAKRREVEENTSGDIPSLDQYEAMLHKMATPNLAPSPRTITRRTEIDRDARSERLARQARKFQEQQNQTQDQQEFDPNNHLSPERTGLSNHLSPADRKLRRRSSLPSMFVEALPKPLTDLKRRSSSLASKNLEMHRGHGLHANNSLSRNQHSLGMEDISAQRPPDHAVARYSWENEGIVPLNLPSSSTFSSPTGYSLHDPPLQQSLPLPLGSAPVPQRTDSKQKPLHQIEDIDEPHDSDRQDLEEQRKNKRNSARLSQLGIKPPLSSKSQLRLSHTLSQSDADEIAALSSPQDQPQPHQPDPPPKVDEGDRQLEQFQLELQQLQNSGFSSPSSRGQNGSKPSPATHSSRSRATTPLGIVAEELVPMPNAPSRQQLLASMDDGSNMASHRSNTPPSRSRPTTPVSIRPPPGPAPIPPTGVPGARKGSPVTGRRGVKPIPPASSSISIQTSPPTHRQRAGSVATVSSMASFTIEGVLQQAPPSTPLPSLPPPPLPSSSGPSPSTSHRSRKSSNGSKELVLPNPQLLNDLAIPSGPLSPEASSGSNQASQVARLKKRVNTLEKELETMEQELSARARDGAELQFKIEHLTLERDSLQQKLTAMQSHVTLVGAPATLASEQSQEFQRAVQQIQDEKDRLMTALMERKDRARSELNSQMESMRMQLIEKEETITRLVMEQQEQAQHSPTNLSRQASGSVLEGEVSRLEGLRSKLEKDLREAESEIRRLQTCVTDQEQLLVQDQVLREELEAKMEALKLSDKNQSTSTGTKDGMRTLEHEVEKLQAEKSNQQEAYSVLQEELEAFSARSQQEEAQYRTLQDTIQRLTLKLSKLESQHSNEILQILQDHEELLEKVVHEHANTLTEMSEQSKVDSETRLLRWREDQGKDSTKDKQEAVARENVLHARLEEQTARNDRLENRMFELEQLQAQHEVEMDTWVNTNKSLERQLAIEQLQQQENIHKMEQMQKENKRLLAILSGLDIAVALEASQGDTEKELESGKSQYEQQRRRWLDQTQLLERKMARAEEEATVIMQKNMDLMVALEMAQKS